MRKSYLEITFRKGRPVAGYLYLPRRPDDVSSKSVKMASGMVVDFARDGRPIGIEINSPHGVSLAAINEIVSRVDEPAIKSELAPLGMVA